MNKLLKPIMVIMLIASLASIAIGQDSLDAVSGNTVTQSRLADIVADDYNSKSVPDQQAQVTLSRVTGNSIPQSRTADIVSYDIANSYDGSSGSSSSYVPSALPEITSAPAEITNIPLLDIIPSPTDTPAPTPAPTITPSKGIRKAMAEKGIDYDLQMSGPEEVLWGNFCFNVTPNDSEVRIKGIVHTQLCPSRDFKPGSYMINISKEGYQNFSQVFILVDEELKNINVSLEQIPPAIIEDTKQNESVIEQTQNNTAENVEKTRNDSNSTPIWLPVGLIIIAAVLGIALWYKLPRKGSAEGLPGMPDEEDDKSTADKIIGLVRNHPGISNEEMATMIQVHIRTIERNVKRLKEEGKL